MDMISHTSAKASIRAVFLAALLAVTAMPVAEGEGAAGPRVIYEGPSWMGPLAPAPGGGVAFVGYLDRNHAHGIVVVREDGEGHVARVGYFDRTRVDWDASGAFYADDPGTATHRRLLLDGSTPTGAGLGAVFGADGALYGCDAASKMLTRTSVDRARRGLGVACATRDSMFVAAPDGWLYDSCAWCPRVRVNTLTGEIQPFQSLPNATFPLAFDADGAAYVVEWGKAAQNILRWNLTTNTTEIVATGAGFGTLARSGSALYVTQQANFTTRILAFDVGRPAFEGFHPVFAPAPAPDLIVGSIYDTGRRSIASAYIVDVGDPQATQRVLVISIVNVGHGPSSPTNVVVRRTAETLFRVSAVDSHVLSVPALGVGERVEIRHAWDASDGLSNHEFSIRVDDPPYGTMDDVVEDDERNNFGYYRARHVAPMPI